MSVARRVAAGMLFAALTSLLSTCKLGDLVSPPRTGTLSVDPAALVDSAPVGSAAPRITRLSVDVAGVEALPWTARQAHQSAWVTLTATRGTTPETLSVSLNPTGLNVGVYRDTLIVAPDGPAGSPVHIPVELRIMECPVTPITLSALSDSVGPFDCASPHRSGRFARLYSFAGSAGDSVSVRLSSADFDGYLVLARSAASDAPSLAENDACRAGLADPCLRYVVLPLAATYVIEATTSVSGGAGAFTLSVTRPRPPSVADSIAQLADDSTAVVPGGGTVARPAVVLRAVVNDPDYGDSVRVEVEVRPVGTAFTGAPTAASGFVVSNTRAAARADGLADGGYHWQARTLDETRRASAWVSFGGNSESAPDFTVAVAQPPNAPTSLAQLKSDGLTAIAVGGATDEPAALFRAVVSDPDVGDQLRLEVEVQPLGTIFTNTPSGSSPPVASGAPVTVTIGGAGDNVMYHWQARAVDQTGRASAWVPFGANPETTADFRVAIVPTRLLVTVQPTTTSAGAAIAPALRVAAQDALGNTLASFAGDVSVALGVNPAGATLSGTTTVVAGAGVATFQDLRIDRVGTGYTLLVTSGSLTTATSAFSVSPGGAAQLTFLVQPTGATAGAALATAVQVAALDALGNTATSFAGGVTLTIGTNPGGGALSGTTTVLAVGGIAVFPGLSINRSGTGYALTASATGLAAATSAQFAVSPGSPARLSLVVQPPTSAASGTAFTEPPVVQIQDGNGNAVATQGVTIAATIASGPGGATVSGGTAASDPDGLATFPGLAIAGPVGSYALSFAAPGLSPVTSGTIGLVTGAPSRLAITTQPSGSVSNGGSFARQPVIQVQDSVGNVVTQSGIQVTATIASGGGTLAGVTTVVTNGSGSAAFTDLSITGTVGARTLSFAASALTGVTSATVTVGPGAASQIAANAGQGQSATAGTAVAIPPSVTVRDASGNAVPGIPVTFSAASGSGSVVPTSAVTSDANGVAVATSWTLGPTAGAQTMQAAAAGLAGSPVTFTATGVVGAPASIAKSAGDNLAGPVGTVLGTAHEVLIADANGNPVPNVSVAWSAATGGGSVTPSLGTTDPTGHARATRTLGGTAGTQTTTATATLGGTPTSVTFTMTATVGTPNQIVIVGGDNQAGTVGATLATSLSVLVTDQSGNPVPGATITWTVTDGGGTVSPTSSLTNPAGIASTSWTLGTATTPTDSTQTARASGAGAPVNFIATSRPGGVSATQTLVSVSPSTITASTGSSAATVTVTARDGFGNPIPGRTVVLAATGGGNSIGQPAATTDANGLATGSFGSSVAGSHVISASVSGLTASQQPTVTVNPAPAANLAFTTQPSNAVAGVAVAPAVAVEVRDAFGNRVTGSADAVTMALGSNPGGGTLSGTVTQNAVGGVATFGNLSINKAGTGYTLAATSGALTGTISGAFNVTAGAVSGSQSTVSVSPGSITAASGTTTITVTARDANGNPISGATVVLAATGSGNTLTQPVGTTDASGLATGTLGSTVAEAKTVSATINGVAITPTAAVTVNPGAVSAAQSTVSASPGTITAGTGTTTITVTARDANNNPISGATVVLAATGSGNTLTQPVGTTNASGVATGTLGSTVAETKTVSATINGTVVTQTAAVTVTPGAAVALTITAQPSATAQSGIAFAQQPVIQLRDASSNAVSQLGVVVTAAIATGGGTLGGTATATTNASGLAIFTNLSITGTVGDRTLSFTAPALTGATSGTVTVIPGTADQLSITTQPSSSAPSGVAFAQQPVLQLRDAAGNAVSQSGVVVTVAIGFGAGTLGGTLTATTNASGLATFTNVSITGTIGDRTLSFTAPSFAAATSNTITVTAGAATQLTITTQPSASAQSGVAFAQQPVIQLRDASNNSVSQAGVVVTAVIATGGGTLGGTLTATTNASGVATFTNLSITGTIGDRTLSFSAPSLTGATSGTITITPGAATQLTITTQPSSSAQSGVPFAQQPVLQLRDAAGNAVSQASVVVTAAIATGGGTLGGTATATTIASGVATFTNLSITGTIGDRTLSFSAPSLTGATSTAITLTPGAATQLTITTQPSSSAQSGAAFAQQPVLQLRDAAGNAVSQAGVVVTAAIATGGGTLGGTLTATTNVSGVATFTSLSISGTIGDRTLSFSATALTVATSGTISLTPGVVSPATSIVSVSNGTVASGAAVTLTLQAKDAAGNNLTAGGLTVVFTATGGTSTGTIGATTDNTNGTYTATFTGVLAGTATTINATIGGSAVTSTLPTVTVTL